MRPYNKTVVDSKLTICNTALKATKAIACISNGSSAWYTDGLKTDRLSVALGKSRIIFQEEIFTIELAPKSVLKETYEIIIDSDSHATLTALSSFVIKSRLVWDCQQLLKQLASHNRVTLS